MLFSKVNTDEISMNEGKLSFIFVFFLDIAIYIAVGIVWYADGGSIVEDINNKVKDNYNLKVYGAALLIAPLGALLRWQLGIRLNSLSWFPIGTFAANVLGVLLDSFSEGYYLKELKPSHGNTI